MNKKGNNNYSFCLYLLLLFIILCQLFRYKIIYLEPNHILESSISNILYPFTFLFTVLLFKKLDFKNSHRIIIKTAFFYLLFVLFLTLITNITANSNSIKLDVLLKQLFTPNNIVINKHIYYYPDILNIIIFSLLFYFSHTVFLILYEAISIYTNKFITFFLSMFIPYTLDTLCYTSITEIFKQVDFNTLILHLTSNFVIVITFTILTTILYCSKKVS